MCLFLDENEFDEIYDYEQNADIALPYGSKIGQQSIKTTSRKVGDLWLWDLFEVNITFQKRDSHVLCVFEYHVPCLLLSFRGFLYFI